MTTNEHETNEQAEPATAAMTEVSGGESEAITGGTVPGDDGWTDCFLISLLRWFS